MTAMRPIINIINRRDINQHAPIVTGLETETCGKLIKDIQSVFPGIIFISPFTRNPLTGKLDNRHRNVTMSVTGRKPSQSMIDNIFYFVKGWMISREMEFGTETIHDE